MRVRDREPSSSLRPLALEYIRNESFGSSDTPTKERGALAGAGCWRRAWAFCEKIEGAGAGVVRNAPGSCRCGVEGMATVAILYGCGQERRD